MKFVNSCKGLALAIALLLASSAVAQSKGSVDLVRPVMVNGTELKPGEYKVRWEGTGPNVELSILQGKTVLAKVPARLSSLEMASPYDAAVTHENGSDVNTLAGFRFKGRTTAIELGDSSEEVQAASAK